MLPIVEDSTDVIAHVSGTSKPLLCAWQAALLHLTLLIIGMQP